MSAAVTAARDARPESERLRAMIDAHVESALRDQDLHWTMLIELARWRRSAAPPSWRCGPRTSPSCATRSAPTSAPAGCGEDMPPAYLTLALLNLLNWTIFWYDRDGELDIRSVADLLAGVFLNGVSGQR
jgi:hypothetical protein